jgi:murein DD-endopeptidase MepM/ murein hydrolase activator NlpD
MARRARALILPLALLCALSAAGSALVLAWRAGERASDLGGELEAAQADVARLQRRGARTSTRLVEVSRGLEAVSHPLHASLAWPVDGAVLSEFGPRGCCSTHPGVDLDAPEGSAVRSAAAGVVVAAGWESGYGNRVVVDHGRGLTTLYAHLESIDVDLQTLVTRASVLGGVGCTGTCDGTHLHFEVRLGGAVSDPELWLPDQREDVALLQFGG